MTSSVSQDIVQSIHNTYLTRTKQSRTNNAQAKQYLPGGDTRSGTYFFPYPTYMQKGEGCYVYDCDSNQYIDFLNNYTSLVHGHCHPAINQAVTAQLEEGMVFGSAAVVQSRLAEILCERLPGMDAVRFTNSGTEATMMAMRAARAVTGKDIIIKMDGGYHGSHDFVEVNVWPDLAPRGLPAPHVEGVGIPACVLEGIIVAPFNDVSAVAGILEERRNEIAAVILEPMPNAGGMIPPQPGYLKGMRELTDEYGILLIFDEIVTLRLDLGGFQTLQGVAADITALGKMIGGGFAAGAFGGRKEIMARFDPAHPQSIMHSGTFNGHNVTMAAGVTTLQHLDQVAIDRINALGERLKRGFNEAFNAMGIKGQATGFGSLVQVHWRDGKIVTPRDTALGMAAAKELPQLLHLELMNRGIFFAPRGVFSVSTPMTEKDVDQAIEAFEATLGLLRPFVEETTPHLIVQ